MWWVETLLSNNWVLLSKDAERNMGEENLVKGTLNLQPSTGTEDIMDHDFFDLQFHFLKETGSIYFNPRGQTLDWLVETERAPNLWVSMDAFAKVFYSAVVADLGQNQQPNIFLNENTLEHFSEGFTKTLSKWPLGRPRQESYEVLKDPSEQIVIKPATIYSNYLCQVPKIKSSGPLLLSIILANFVFLSAVWKIMTLSATWIEIRNNPQADYCIGCVTAHNNDNLEGSPLGSPLTHRGDSQLKLPSVDAFELIESPAMRTSSFREHETLLSR